MSGNEQRVNRKRLFQAAFDQSQSLRPVITPRVAPLVPVISINRGCDERTRQKRVQVNRINIGENDSGLPFQQFGEMSLRGKVGRALKPVSKMNSVPRLRSVDAHCVITGTRGIPKARCAKQDKNRQGDNNPSCGKKILYGPRHRQHGNGDGED